MHPSTPTSQRVDEAVLHVPASPRSTEQAPINDLLATVLNSSASSKATAKEATGHDSAAISSNVASTAMLGYAKATCGGLYPSKWQKQTDELVAEAQQLVTDSSRWGLSLQDTLLISHVAWLLLQCVCACNNLQSSHWHGMHGGVC
jgi:hypothetical protein